MPRRGAEVVHVFGTFRLEPVEKCLFHEARPLPLTPKAFVEENNLAQNISMLRRVLGDRAGAPQYIETVPKRPYRFVEAIVERIDGADDSAREPVRRF